jgi:pimeloyl-ACP methyl ester carboxylesterase
VPAPASVAPESGPAPAADVSLPAGFHAALVEAPVFGGQVFTVEGGRPDGPLVVLVHGLGENGARDFYSVLPALARDHQVISFDLPGFGRSTHGTLLYSPERYAEFIRALVMRRHRGTFNLVGHSMGGAIALMYAARYPADLQRLFLIDAAGFLHRKAYVSFAVAAGLDNILGVFAGPGKEVLDATLQAVAEAVGPVPQTPEPDFLLNNDLLRSTILRTPTRIAALATMLENFGPPIAAVRTPTWILWGRNDRIASVRTAKILEARLPVAQLRVLEASGHDPMASEPDAVARFLVEGLAASPVPVARRRSLSAWAPRTAPGRCEGQSGMRFEGDYPTIEIAGCQDVRIEGVRAGSIRILDSVVSVENTQVTGDGVALDVKDSKVEITASDFAGEVALLTSGCDIDLAGITLRGTRRSVQVDRPSRLIFSISRLDSPVSHRFVHELLEPVAGVEL